MQRILYSIKILPVYIKALIVLNLFDYLSTSILIFNGIQEGNPLVRWSIEQIGLVAIPIVKLIPLSIIIAFSTNQYGWFKIAITGTCIIYAVVMLCVNLPLLICVIFFLKFA